MRLGGHKDVRRGKTSFHYGSSARNRLDKSGLECPPVAAAAALIMHASCRG